MLYVRKLFTQDLRDGKQIAFPKDPSLKFFNFDFPNKEDDRAITFIFKSTSDEFQEYDGKVIKTRLYSAGSEARMDGEVKAFIRDYLNAKVGDLLIMKNKGTKHIDYEFMFVPQSNPIYASLTMLIKEDNHSVIGVEEKDNNKLKDVSIPHPLQQIFYGAPGTGKSNTIKESTKDQKVVRVTFHPDSDYASFVGVYKPTMKGDKIEYSFVKQAFLKAYLKAWQKMTRPIAVSTLPVAESESPTDMGTISTTDDIIFECAKDSTKLEITSADAKKIGYRTRSISKKNCGLSLWNKLCEDENYTTGSGISFRLALCKAIKEETGQYEVDKYEEGIRKLFEDAGTQDGIVLQSPNQHYYLYPNPEDDSTFVTITKNNSAYREAIQKFYGKEKGDNAQSKIAEILENIDNTDFDAAWEKLRSSLSDAGNSTGTPTTESPTVAVTKEHVDYVPEPQYLIIEEINRGNCAQIFGDLFQLLDRQDSGYSTYPIDSDSDMQQAIEKAFREETEYKLDGKLNIDGVVEGYVSNYDKTLSEDVQEGRVLLLPPNLCIWATMNTSDQSLFPMDSAFKRRWDWVYIPIAQGMKKDEQGKETSEPLGWQIRIDEKHEPVDWWQFLQKVNVVIGKLTSSEDKQLGYFFCKPDEKDKRTISAKKFVGKVLFYLWNDILKDYAFDDDLCKKGKDKKDTLYFADFYSKQDELDVQNLIAFFENLDKEQPEIGKDKVTLLREVKKMAGNSDGEGENEETPATPTEGDAETTSEEETEE